MNDAGARGNHDRQATSQYLGLGGESPGLFSFWRKFLLTRSITFPFRAKQRIASDAKPQIVFSRTTASPALNSSQLAFPGKIFLITQFLSLPASQAADNLNAANIFAMYISWHGICFYLPCKHQTDFGRRGAMPYLRLYSQQIGIEQKRVIAQKLIQITLRTFQLRPEDSNRITIQFVPLPHSDAAGSDYSEPPGSELSLEVLAHNLTREKKTAFAKQATDALATVVAGRSGWGIARFFGIKSDAPAQVFIQFNSLSPGISDPFVPEPERRAA